MRIALAGTGYLGASLLKPLLASPHEVVAIIQDGRRFGILRRFLVPRLARWIGGSSSMTGHARKLGLPIIWLDKMTERELRSLRKLNVDVLLVGGFGIILKKPLLALPNVGCINTHSSLLPRHRGPNPFYAAIVSGDRESGVTFHIIDEGIDTGPILAQASFPLGPTDTVLTVYQRSCEQAGRMVVEVMDNVAREGIAARPQAEAAANYVKKPTIDDSWLDWSLPAVELDRLVRACSPTPMPRFRYRGVTIYVARTEYNDDPVDAAPGTVVANRGIARIATGEGTLLLRMAFSSLPLPWTWPAPWFRPRVGESLVPKR